MNKFIEIVSTYNPSYLNSYQENNHFGIAFVIGLLIFTQQSLSSVNFGITLRSNNKNIENYLSGKITGARQVGKIYKYKFCNFVAFSF